MAFRKTPEEKEQKQRDMVNLEKDYEQFLASKISEKRNVLLSKYPQIKTLFEGWLYGVYVAIIDNQEVQDKKGKLYYLFENITESVNKYKLNYTIDNENECVFNVSDLKNFPKSYLTILKRHNYELKKDKSTVRELICAHIYKLDDEMYIHHSDYNKLNNNVKNLVPLEKEYFNSLSEDQQKNLAKAQQYIPEKYKIEFKRKPKDVIKIEYRACDLYYNHRLPIEKIAITLRNRLSRAETQRVIKLYPYFRTYLNKNKDE